MTYDQLRQQAANILEISLSLRSSAWKVLRDIEDKKQLDVNDLREIQRKAESIDSAVEQLMQARQ